MAFHLCYTILIIKMVCTICFYCVFLNAAATAAALTDKDEIEALKIIANKLGKGDWDFNVDPCTGTITFNSAFQGLSCDCSDIDNTACHVTSIILPSQNLRGGLSPELANLQYLQHLDLTDNYLSGPIPPRLGTLAFLKHLSLSRNLLSGPIPKELGNLIKLTKLFIHSNHLSGTLPSELGNLTMLEKLHLSSNQLFGEIPATLMNLGNLTEFWASSNNFTGKIPSGIGSLTNLEKLVLQGTSLVGPIPSTISNLAHITDLRISDITKGGSSLEFMLSLKNLKYLVLKNSFIFGKIPPGIDTLNKLETLDLSFNNLNGTIPTSLRSLQNLKFLFLGNNNLTGELPSWLSTSKAKIDLSYNKISGTVPPKLTDKNSNVNLIGNNFDTKPMRDSPLACLQKNFQCDKNAPNYHLAINCGGIQLKTSAENIVFDKDDAPLGAASFYLSPRKNWGVSNIGYFMDSDSRSNTRYLAEGNLSFTLAIGPNDNTSLISPIDQRLYKTARTSPTSLRYYGLGLQNGPYRVELHFAEIQFVDSKISKGVRIFDIYIQGNKILKDFNVKEAAREQNAVVVKNYTINVTENFLDIHFFWAGKGTCDPRDGTYGPLISAIIVKPEFVPNIPKNSKTLKTVIITVGVTVTLGLLIILSLVFIKKMKKGDNVISSVRKDEELKNMEGNYFSLKVMKLATKNFDTKNKIGAGGFGAVYKGILPDGRNVAIKQLSLLSKQGNHEFLNEVSTISAVQHPNLIKLYGCCVEEEELLLVYEYVENDNLARALFGPNKARIKLYWPTRYSICLGVARGLAYLHEESLLRIVHRDIKSTNILLDKDLQPKIADFGLARLFDEENTHVSTRVAGTVGYLAPEYAFRGHLTDKADVYSFGVVALEVVSGRSHIDISLGEERAYLLEWVWQLYDEKRMLKLLDADLLHSGYSEEEVTRMINVGLLCICEDPGGRPCMSAIVEMLEGRIETPSPQSRPGYLNQWETWELASGVHHADTQSSTNFGSSREGPWKESSSLIQATLGSNS